MPSFACKKWGSAHVVKNGRDSAGRQKYHCKTCGVHTTTADAAQEYAAKVALMEQLHHERVSQRGIARLTGLSRSTIIKQLKKKSSHRLPQR
jgi:transposase-like protein